ncbi:DUF2993 domain-containing protein [Solwaraspora sp. WMMA2056]|uniref:LmeA family phospholipid-binding protein n=1 Tax=Solwaraspora sp. WMMA2056 TaxID=3015161 RepID=UPI00259BAB37|nr:DUF2993 domain-containing protein [Solwaraspora sp. WMMA2056]WJK41882.1 DUF2993 domain-containing protein [Solwaraspora sp. WMMA2056]
MRIWRPRSRRAWLAVTAVGLVLATLLVADRVAARLVAGRLADAVACATGMAEPPRVTVHGFPFVSQLLTGRFAGLTITADELGGGELDIGGGLDIGGEPLVAGVTVRLSDVEIVGDLTSPSGVRVGQLSAAATIDLGRLTELAGTLPDGGAADDTTSDDTAPDAGTVFGGGLFDASDLRIRGTDNGQLVVELTAQMLGQALPVTVYAVPELDGRMLRITPVEVELFGLRRSADQLPGALGERRIERELPELPAGLTYQELTVTADGLLLAVGGESIDLDDMARLRPTASAGSNDTEPCREQG